MESTMRRTIIIIEHETPHPVVSFGSDVVAHVSGMLREQDLGNLEDRIIRPMTGALDRASLSGRLGTPQKAP